MEQEGGGDEGEDGGGDFSSQVAMLKPCRSFGQRNGCLDGGETWACNTVPSMWVNSICVKLWQLAASWHLLTNVTIKGNVFTGFVVLCSVCKRAAQNIHTLSRAAEHRRRPSGSSYKKGGETCKKMAWHLELVSSWTQIYLACGHPVKSAAL